MPKNIHVAVLCNCINATTTLNKHNYNQQINKY